MKKNESYWEIATGVLAAIALIAIILLFFSGCYTESKAERQFDRAAGAYPKLPAYYCAENFQIKEKIIKGDSIITTDTIYLEESFTDTLITKDTVRITTTFPAKIITKTIHTTDTVIKESTAKLAVCEISNRTLIGLLEKKTNEADQWKAKAQKRGKYLWLLIILLVAIGGWKIYSKFNKVKI